MKPTFAQIQASHRFAIALCAITVVGNIIGHFMTGNDTVALIAFLCFLPMVFWHVSHVQRQTLEFAEGLDQRLRELEAANKLPG